jgi:hypothetical protein
MKVNDENDWFIVKRSDLIFLHIDLLKVISLASFQPMG